MNEYTQEDVKNIQRHLLDTAKRVHKVLTENNIPYYMQGGTLLGAVRHQGFIPWDDDFDIAVPRPDYDRMTDLPDEVWEREQLNLGFYKRDPEYRHKFVKVYDKTTTIVYGEGHEVKGLFVDIFPLDGVDESICSVDQHYEDIAYLKKQLWFSYDYPHANKEYEGRELALEKGSRYWHEKLNECMREHDYDTCPVCGDLFGLSGKRHVMDKAVYGTPVLMPFEDTAFYGCAQPDIFLSAIYGNYMKLPPEERRVPSHITGQFEYYNMELPYEEYLKRERITN